MSSHKQILLIFFLVLLVSFAQAQTDDTKRITDNRYLFIQDTLFINQQPELYVGQKLIVGKATDNENGWYSTIGFKSEFAFPIWFMRDLEMRNNYDYQIDPQRRTNDKVKEYLHKGDTLTITKLKKEGNRRRGYYYTAYFKTGKFLALYFRSDIIAALDKKEILRP